MSLSLLERLAELLGVGGFLIWAIDAYKRRVRLRVHRVELADSRSEHDILFEIENISPSATSLVPQVRIQGYNLAVQKKKRLWGGEKWTRNVVDVRARIETTDRMLPAFTPRVLHARLVGEELDRRQLSFVLFLRITFATTSRQKLTARLKNIDEPVEWSRLKFWGEYLWERWFRRPSKGRGA